jgi:hypothetical protein
MDEYESEDEGLSDMSSIGSDLEDPRVDFCQVILPMCRAIYSPSSIGKVYICIRLPPCQRHTNHHNLATPRGDPGVYPSDRARTRRVRGILNGRLTEEEVQLMREIEREANRALAAAQAGMQSPRQFPPRVNPASPSTGEENGYNTVQAGEEQRGSSRIAPAADPDAPISLEEVPPAHHGSENESSPARAPPAGDSSHKDLSNLVAQLTNALMGLNTRLKRLESPVPPPRSVPPPPPPPPATRVPRAAPEGILRTTVSPAAQPPEVEFLGATRHTASAAAADLPRPHHGLGMSS